MIIKNGTDTKIEETKARLGLSGDVYIYNDHYIESLESHKTLIPTSTATTIEDAEEERVQYEAEKTARMEAERRRAEEENAGSEANAPSEEDAPGE